VIEDEQSPILECLAKNAVERLGEKISPILNR